MGENHVDCVVPLSLVYLLVPALPETCESSHFPYGDREQPIKLADCISLLFVHDGELALVGDTLCLLVVPENCESATLFVLDRFQCLILFVFKCLKPPSDRALEELLNEVDQNSDGGSWFSDQL